LTHGCIAKKQMPSPHSLEKTFAEKVLLSFLALLLFFILFQLTLFPYGRDQSIYAVVARTMLQGGAPYKDAWDFKPPGIYFIYEFSRMLFGDSMQSARIVEALCFLSLAGAFSLLSKRHFSTWQAGILGAVLAAYSHVRLGFWDTGQPEAFGGVLLAWALVGATYFPQNDIYRTTLKQSASWFVSGMLFAGAALLKPFLGGGLMVSMVVVAWRVFVVSSPGRRLRAVAAVFFSFVIGALPTLLACFLYFVKKNALPDLYYTFFTFVPRYASIAFQARFIHQHTFLSSSPDFLELLVFTLFQWLPWFSFITCSGVIFMLLLPASHPRENEGCIHILGTVLPVAIGVAWQAKLFPYHFTALLPLVSLLAAWGFWKVWLQTRWKWLLLMGVILSVAWQVHTSVAIEQTRARLHAFFSNDPYARDKFMIIYDINGVANRKAAQWISARTPKNSSLYIWGFEPVIYDMAQRTPASRFIYNVPQRTAWDTADSRAALMKELSNRPPAAIIVVHKDRLDWVTGSTLDSAEELRRFPELAALLKDGYHYAISFEDLDIYMQNTLPPEESISR
jgi:hypothetical protein